MRHQEAINKVGEVLGFNPDALPPDQYTAVDRAMDEVFERGYQAGVHDQQPIPYSLVRRVDL